MKGIALQNTNRYAFKEWAATCLALADGVQSLVLRKGGIHEHQGQFTVEHREFWLYPTQFHQTATDFRPDQSALIEPAANAATSPGTLRIEVYADVEEVIELTAESQLAALLNLQILSAATLTRRFNYRQPGLVVLPVRIFRLPQPVELPESPHFAGCRTWVDLEHELPTSGLEPVIADDVHQRRMTHIHHALAVSDL